MKQQWPRSILIIKLSSIGDVVHTIPALEVLRKTYPRARIDWVVEDESAQIVLGHKDLNRVIVSRRKKWARNIARGKKVREVAKEIKEFLVQVRNRDYDLIIDFQGLLRSGLVALIARGTHKVGMSGTREASWMFLTKRPFKVNYNQHAIDRYLELCKHLGCGNEDWEGFIPYGEREISHVDELLRHYGVQKGHVVVINPVARWKTKLWRPEFFALLADKIQDELSYRVVFTGARGDYSYLQQICNMMRTPGINSAGATSLKELAYLYKISAATVTTDTGPMHIAAAMKCPVIALFGPTDPRRTGPYGNGHRIISSGLECSPCFRKQCDNIRCMNEITVDQVFTALSKTLNEHV
ncbi:MAG: lipopolysaccharide heptosyltransferase I [Deltaproteobacteria bacterium]|nr:MAG: lipopolysaccharide heptosyltransferase I [Deltaproteobacteria bacterium]